MAAEPTLLQVVPPASARRARLVRRAKLLAWGGNAWHLVEFAIAVGAGIAASSVALVAFGIDSLIEVAAGGVVVWLFTGRRVGSASAERLAQRLIAASFFALAVYIGFDSIRALGGDHPEASWVGIGLALVTAPTMPLLARAKRKVGVELGSRATQSEAGQNMLCAYLSIALLVGLGANALFGWWWADPLAGLVIAAVALREGVRSWRGEGCGDGCC
ncbi:MAG TPA: cation transporter [Gaiellales bacterium]|nr:cation transporter [Gaiellales bacterium]